MIGGMALVIIDRLRQRQQGVQQLAQAQEHGRVVRQQLAAAQLQTIQARVDPQLLFDMLAAVKRFYERDAQRAELMLDELAAFLRAALPRLRSARSTLEIEFDLVRSYVRLLRWCADAPVELDIRQPEALATAAFPAGVLLPLLIGPATAARCITLEAAGAGGRFAHSTERHPRTHRCRVGSIAPIAARPVRRTRWAADTAPRRGRADRTGAAP